MNILITLSTCFLGFFLGTQITEAVLMVPYWKSLTPDAFFLLHKTYGKKVYSFFAPITIMATIFPLVTVAFIIQSSSTIQFTVACIGLFTLAFFSTYFLYFKGANKSFTDRSISDTELADSLKKWEYWHWTRIGFETIAFICSLLLLIKI
ncbi:protein of unknown function [Tenacibaculum sp. MAR_2009_124]|uniref:DUF1772 domain-containing protein n=1 Tax=Tenacibaculum sp. MAR_2009_124 TaxID=1250059 RepID=UPI000899C903|nr:DUF1772 domain-containing protein [Tenacibaculum sp. MAR_2009_124]SEB52751.1 protein of unknown function [Tenacibaculum sp. MAR_2009_124]